MTNNEKDIKDTESTQGKHKEIDEYIDQKIEEYYESLSEGKEL